MKIKKFRPLLFLSFLFLMLMLSASCNKNHSHTFDEWITLREPTCTKQGLERRSCSCGEYESRNIEPLGHTEGKWKTDTQPTCLESGTKIQICSSCKATLNTETIEAKGHNITDEWIVETPASCEQIGESYKICSDCGFEYARRKDIVNHRLGAIVTEIVPSCTQEGKKSQYCTLCNQLLASVTIPKTEHEYIMENGKNICKHCKKPEVS